MTRRFTLNSRLLITAFPFFFSLGCGNPLGGRSSTVDPGHLPGAEVTGIKPARGAEFVPSSQQFKPSASGRYLIQGSISPGPKEIEQVTLQRKFKLFSNVQGELISGGKAQ